MQISGLVLCLKTANDWEAAAVLFQVEPAEVVLASDQDPPGHRPSVGADPEHAGGITDLM